MKHIVLNDEQIRILSQAAGAVEARTPDGKCLGYIDFTFEEKIVEECKRLRESSKRSFSSQQVKAHFRALEEAANQGATEDQLWALLKQLQNGSQE